MTTIKDIAKSVGLSVTTVSRALNGYSDVNAETRKKIIETAKKLNYTPNAIARSLVTKKSKTVGLIVSELNRSSAKDNFTFEVLCGINAATRDYGYDMILFSTDPDKQKQKSYTQLCRERGVDGAILQGIRTDDPYLQEVVESRIPCMLIDIPIANDSVGFVTTDNEKGAQTAVEHLIKLGHRKIGFINGHEHAFVSRERKKGYVKALQQNGLSVNQSYMANGEFKEDVARKEAKNLLRRHPEITALFCASDLMAFGAIEAAEDLGITVPRGLSVIGYDDIMLASYVRPRLTTIAQNQFAIGYEAARLLIAALEGNKNRQRKKFLPTKLILRETTASPGR